MKIRRFYQINEDNNNSNIFLIKLIEKNIPEGFNFKVKRTHSGRLNENPDNIFNIFNMPTINTVNNLKVIQFKKGYMKVEDPLSKIKYLYL